MNLTSHRCFTERGRYIRLRMKRMKRPTMILRITGLHGVWEKLDVSAPESSPPLTTRVPFLPSPHPLPSYMYTKIAKAAKPIATVNFRSAIYAFFIAVTGRFFL
jgi:hypothetical protein